MGRPVIDLTGQTFGRLTVLGRGEDYLRPSDGSLRPRWLCKCSCGNEVQAHAAHLKKHGDNQSCGCLGAEKSSVRLKEQATKHGHHAGGKHSPTFSSWNNMMGRCYRESHKSYPWYGAKGIKVCERWHSFENFLEDMGERPEGMTLDRKDLTQDYSPGNCKWSTRKEQDRHRSSNVMIEHDGRTMCATDWAKELGMNYHTFRYRHRVGLWP